MKKEYIKPETSLVEVEVMTMLAISNGNPTIRVNHSTVADEELSVGRESERGWGDLWVE